MISIKDFLQIGFLLTLMACLQKPTEKGDYYFSGEIEYAYSYTSEILDLDSLRQIKPQKGVFRFDHLNYQSRFFSQVDTVSYYYLGETNFALRDSNMIMDPVCQDYSLSDDSILYSNMFDTQEQVMDQACKVLEFETKNQWVQYLVSTEFQLSPRTYKDHVAYNWQFYGTKAAGGLILKLEHRFKTYTMKGIATRIRIFYSTEEAIDRGSHEIKKICSGLVTDRQTR